MSRQFLISLTSLLMCIGSNYVSAQGVPDCLRYCPAQLYDTLAVDTCGRNKPAEECGELLKSIYFEGYSKVYARERWEVMFDVSAFHIPYAHQDSTITVSWKDIDTAYPEIIAAFSAIEQRYGQFTLQKLFPEDTSTVFSRVFLLTFRNFVNVDSATDDLSAIPKTSAGFTNFISYLATTDKTISDKNSVVAISKNGDIVTIQANESTVRDLTEVRVFNISGELMSLDNQQTVSGNTMFINVSMLPPGVYLIVYRGTTYSFVK